MKEVKRYVEGCDQCQRMKNRVEMPAGKLKPNKVLERLWQCCGNYLSQRQMITQAVNLLVGYQVGNSQENSTRSLFLIRVLFIQMSPGPCYYYLTLPYSPCSILISASLLTQGHHVAYMCPDIIFQIFPSSSRLMTLHHVTCHVTSLSRAFFIILKEKEKEKEI